MSFKDKILRNQSPWGSPPGGGSSNDGNGSGTRREPPNLDDVIKNFQKRLLNANFLNIQLMDDSRAVFEEIFMQKN